MAASVRRAAAWPWLAVAALGLVLGGVPLLAGAPGGDDAYYHAMRSQQHARCWRLGVAYPRWYPDLNGGLGGPEPRAYPLVPLVAHAALALATGDGVTAIALATALIPALAGLAMMAALRRRGAGTGAALAGAAAWAAAPYALIALHERAALAEALGLALLPLALEALLPHERVGRGGVVRAGARFALLLATQLPLAAMAGALALACRLARGRAGHPIAAVLAGGLGVALAAASWLPNVASVWRLQGERLSGPGYRWQDSVLPFGRGADPVLAGHLSLALAATAVLLIVAAVAGRREARLLAGAGLAALALATPVLGWVHGVVPGLAFLQFPWRWVGVAGCLGVLAIARVERGTVRAAALVAFVLPLVVPFAWRWRLPPGAALRPTDTGAATARAATRFGVPPILPSLPAYLPRGVDLRAALAAAVPALDEARVQAESRPGRVVATVSSPAVGTVRLPVLADDGWSVTVDGRPTRWTASESLVAVSVGPGPHRVVARQTLLPEDVAGIALSVATLIAFAAGRVLRSRVFRTHGVEGGGRAGVTP